jgi:hypothetical protein
MIVTGNNIMSFLPIGKRDDRPSFELVGEPDRWRLLPPADRMGRDRPWTASELRLIADDLRDIARSLHGLADDIRGEERDEILGDVQVFAGGKVRRWVSNRIETDEQRGWLRELLASEPETD